MAKHEASDETLQLYFNLHGSVCLEPKGKNMPYTFMNGNMYSFVAKEGYVAIRLSEKDKKTCMEKYHAKPAISYGTVMKDYVHVPDELLNRTQELKEYMLKSHDFAKTLKPKPTKKK